MLILFWNRNIFLLFFMRAVHSEKAPKAIGPYSQAVRSRGLLFCSGQLPMKLDGTMVEGTFEEKVVQILENLKAVVEEAGSSFGNVLKVTVFMVDLNQFAEFNEIYSRYFVEHKPARSTVQVVALPKGSPLEIECIAKVV